MPGLCPCGQNYDVTHAMNCKRDDFIIMTHNNVRAFQANLLKTIFNDVEVEPKLQKIDNEFFAVCCRYGHKIMIYFNCLYVTGNTIQFLGFNVFLAVVHVVYYSIYTLM